MRTVSFFRGTAAVFGVVAGGGVGVLSGALMRKMTEFEPFSEIHTRASIPFSSRVAKDGRLLVSFAFLRLRGGFFPTS